MQNTSTLYNQILADKNHRFEVKLSINGVDYGMDSIFSAKTESRIFDSKPAIGGCYSATLDFTIISDGINIPRMASVIPYFRVVNDAQVSEWIQHGLFFIDHRKVTNNGDNLSVFQAECFDAMLKANAIYSTSSLSWPAIDTQIVAEIASAIGIPVDPRTTAILTKGFSVADLPVNYTYRDVLSFIAVAYAGNWIITDEGKLRLIPIVGNNDTLPVDKELVSMNVSQKRNGYTKVAISISEEEAIISGTSDDLVMEAYCPYATQAIADDILATLSSYRYEPFNANGVWSNPAVEIGDKLTAVGETVTIYARTVNYGPGMVMNLSAPDDGYIDHEYAYESPAERHYKQTLGDIRREIVVTADTISSTISRRLDNMQEQIDNNIETFTGSAVPTLANYPANSWTTTTEKDKHIGDLYVVNSQGGDYEGFYYRFEKTGSTYQWRLLKDTEVTKALAEAEEALRRVGIAETQIEQNAEAITLRATKTEAQGYANTAQANAISAAATDATTKANAAESAAKTYADAQITVSADAITSNVSATYETKSDSATKLNTAKTYAEGQASAAERGAKNYTDGKLTNYSTTAQMNSAITQSASSITSTVSATYETKASATQKLNTAKSYAETQAAGAEASAVSAAAADATTKANAAEAGAKGYTDNKLTGYSTTAQMNSAITQSASEITSNVAATYTTKEDFNNLEIGGENLLPDSDAPTLYATYKPNGATQSTNRYFSGTLPASGTYTVEWIPLPDDIPAPPISSKHCAHYVYDSISTGHSNAVAWRDRFVPMVVGETYTMSAWFYVKTGSIRSQLQYGVATPYAMQIQVESASGKWVRRSWTFVAEAKYINPGDDNSKAWTRPYIGCGSVTNTASEAYVTGFQMEIGNRATAWGADPDDVGYQVGALGTRVASAEATLSVQAGQIASKVSETDYNGNTIASKINQTATTVKINAAKIDLQGAVTISDFDSAAQAALVKNTTTKTQYAQSASSATAPTSGWQDTIPAYNATNKYIWLRVATTKTFADNTSSTTYSTPVVDVNLTKSIQDAATAQSTATGAATAASTAQTTANNAASAASTAQTTANNAASAASTAQSTANAALGTTKSTQQYYLSTSSTSATGGTWQDTVPTWSSGKYVWTRIKTDATTKSGTALSPVYSTAVYDANLTTALSTASSASSAASAAQSTADGAVKSSSVKTQYYLSTSASSATGGSWSDTIPTWADGKYLWTRIATTTTPVSGTASTTYQPSANGAYDKNLTSALSTATAAASTAAAAQTKANAALVTSVSVYFRASTSTAPGKPTEEVTSTAVDTSDTWTLCMPRPKKGTTYYTCEQNKDGNGNVSWTAVRQMANATYVASWASSSNATYIDGANIYTGTVTADKLAANEIFTQKLTATDLTITGGKININTGGSSFDVITLTTDELSRSVLSPVGIRFDQYVSGSFTSRVNINYAGSITTYQAGTSNGVAISSNTPLVTVRNGQSPTIDRTDISSTSVSITAGSSGAKRILSHTGLEIYAGTSKYSALIWPDSNGAGRFILGDGTSTKWRTELTNSGLVFRNDSDKVTARYVSSATTNSYTPSNDTLTFLSSSKIRIRKCGLTGVCSLIISITNPTNFATGTHYLIATLPEQDRPAYAIEHITCNSEGSPYVLRIDINGDVSLYRYANTTWSGSWIRAEIPMVFANP